MNFVCFKGLKSVQLFVLFVILEKEAEKLKERLAQEEAEAMEMEDEENKNENTNNIKEVSKKFSTAHFESLIAVLNRKTEE